MTQKPSSFFEMLLAKHKEALAGGHLIYYGAETFLVETGKEKEIHYHIRYVPALNKKPQVVLQNTEAPKDYRAAPKKNPFLPCDQELLFSDSILPYHNIVLNKFCVIPGHTLLTTKEFKSQSDPLSLLDFEALFAIKIKFGPTKTLGFFNCGELSGASQPHKHVQLIPLTEDEPPIHKFLSKSLEKYPVDVSIELPHLPYLHRVTKFSESDPKIAYMAYSQMLKELGNQSQHHNLAIFENIMYLLPRSKEKFEANGEEFSINSLGAVHMVLARSSDQVESLKTRMGLSGFHPIPDSLWVGQWVGWAKSKV